ncbi:Pvc16 family protein [Yoonia vestfoldensis]|uniref:Pvc16 family protein n=1 Tax=Yoonia vestfoldensis TaxID=245188 RepID=UPI00037E4DF0|nr:Pvc16 family protein [Yoonia vestfoldensis]
MSVFSLSSVTASLQALFKLNIESRLANAYVVNTSALSPLDVAPQAHLVNIFLFHFHPEGKQTIHENPAIDPPMPMSFSKPLTLYYHLTAHHNAAQSAHLAEQDLLGHALATLIDRSTVNDELMIGGVAVLDAALADDANAFELEVLTKTDGEALNIWAGYEGGAIRPSLYFKVKNVRLKPETPLSFSGPILSIGELVVPSMGPRITFMQSRITARVPTSAGLVERSFPRNPAEMFIGADAPDRQIVLQGRGIDPGAGVELTLPVAAGQERFRVDFADNQLLGWAIVGDRDSVTITWADNIRRPVGGVPTALALSPGPAQIRLFKTEYMTRDGNLHPVEMPSNPVSITLHPHIADIAPVAGRRYRISLDGGYDLTALAPEIDHGSFIRLAIGGTVYQVADAPDGLAAGQCAIADALGVDVILDAAADETALAFVQLWVRDAVSQPFWMGGA